MFIRKVLIRNYRNIGGIEIDLHPQCNYLIGENNLGKSNFLQLLTNVCAGKSFDDDDFENPEAPIEVDLTIQMETGECGFFGDNFSPDDSSKIQIRVVQGIRDAYPSVICLDTNEVLQLKQLKKLNHFRYESTATPSKELKLDNKKGIGLLMNGIIERFVSEKSTDSFLNDGQIDDLAAFINEHLNKIQGFKNYQIGAAISPNTSELLTSMFYLSDGERKLDTTGAGVQYVAMASISVLCYIMELYRGKSIKFEERLYTDDSGKKLLPIILSIDEPEVHLHPFLQRSLIGFYKRILKNADPDFLDLIKTCFDIDGLSGQIIIVTHSTDALVGDYRNLIRFYKSDGEKTNVVSGASPQIGINKTTEKQLVMHFPEIKEAFYSHCVILIEGQTEYGCMNSFAEKLNVSLDDHSIYVLNAGGESNIRPLRQLLDIFKIPSVAIYDGDVKSKRITDSTHVFFTEEPCFEVEIVKKAYQEGGAELIRSIAYEIDERVQRVKLDKDNIKNGFSKMGYSIEGYTPVCLADIADDDEEEFCKMFSSWLMSQKTILTGRLFGETLPANMIPDCYVNAIRKAQEVSTNV